MKITYFKNIAFTYLTSEHPSSNGAIILLDGIPSNPESKSELELDLHSKGFDVFFPRYEGTWESRGEFLKRSPSLGIAEFARKLKSGVVLPTHKYKTAKIFLLGASFGGGLALALANEKVVDKVCALSAVISFQKVRGLDTLESYLQENQAENFRFKSKNWEVLLQDKFYRPDKNKLDNPEGVLIIAGSEDDQIPIEGLREYVKKTGAKLIVRERGHITLSKITQKELEKILNFFISN